MAKQHDTPIIERKMAPFSIDGLSIPYPEFVPKLYNLCAQLGFRKGLIMPSRAFCSDANQGLPIILLTKHFGTFPFDHGRVGGIVATDRHGPHSNHGEDAVIVQATHVGYNPKSQQYGLYRRSQKEKEIVSASCGKLTQIITPYLEMYHFAKHRIFLHKDDQGRFLITVKNSFVDFQHHPVERGLVLRLQKIAKVDRHGIISALYSASTTQTYEVSEEFKRRVDETGFIWEPGSGKSIDNILTEDFFFFKNDFE